MQHSRLQSPSPCIGSRESHTCFAFACSRMPDCSWFLFSVQSLQNMSRELEARGLPGRADMVWLLDCSTNISDAELDAFAQYGHGIGPEKAWPHFFAIFFPSLVALPRHMVGSSTHAATGRVTGISLPVQRKTDSTHFVHLCSRKALMHARMGMPCHREVHPLCNQCLSHSVRFRALLHLLAWQSMVAPLAPTRECARPEGAACYEIAPDQTCSGRLAPAAAAAAAAARSRADVRSELVQRAHARGLVVHPYTFRNEVLQSLKCSNGALAQLTCQQIPQDRAGATLTCSTHPKCFSLSM